MFISPCIAECTHSMVYIAEILVCRVFFLIYYLHVYIHLHLSAAIPPDGMSNFHPTMS